MRLAFLLSFLFLVTIQAQAAIPKTSMILQRTSENAGSGIYQIDQEVHFPNGPDTLVLKETWMIENENNMKLLVTGAKELKDQVSFYIQVINGNRIQGSSNKRITEDFIERYFHLRNTESFAQVLIQMKLVPPHVLAKKPLRNLKEFDPQPENFIRLSRTGGTIAYAIGTPSADNQELPGFWIEQDQFVLRKFRLPTGVEVAADKYSAYARGLMYPRTQSVRWGANQVTVQTISVSSRTKEAWAQFGQKAVNKVEALNALPAAALVEEFYKRFR
jgi:hypothetical protein